MSDWFDGSGNGVPVDVPALMDSEVPVLLARIVAAGAMVSVGTTSDGGACGITVTLDGRWRREYFRSSDEAASWLLEAVEAVEGSTALPASSGQRSRRRRQKPV